MLLGAILFQSSLLSKILRQPCNTEQAKKIFQTFIQDKSIIRVRCVVSYHGVKDRTNWSLKTFLNRQYKIPF